MEKNEITTQVIGVDVGRGYVKGYSEFNEVKRECLFKSVVGLGRNIDFSNYDDPIYLTVNNEDYFAGILAEEEGDNPVQNSKDDKTTNTVKKLIYAVLNKLASTNNVKIMLGVPNKLFRKSEMQKIIETYKNNEITINDNINGSYKTIKIKDISIFREGDAALLWHVNNKDATGNAVGMVTVGFRTTEFSYYSKDMKYNDKFSKTMELGNKTALEYCRKKIELETGVSKTLAEIDSSNRYNDAKAVAYRNLAESIEQEIEGIWASRNEMDIHIAGGTALKLKFDDFSVLDDAQMLTARGLWLVGTKRFK